MKQLTTPDGRYFVHQGRLWRCTNPRLDQADRQRFVDELMKARLAVRESKRSGNRSALKQARASVNAAKIALGERGPTWWEDDSDYNRHLIKNTPYADWFARHKDA